MFSRRRQGLLRSARAAGSSGCTPWCGLQAAIHRPLSEISLGGVLVELFRAVRA